MIHGKNKLFTNEDIDPIVTGLLVQYIDCLAAYLDNPQLPTMIRVKLYELLSSLI